VSAAGEARAAFDAAIDAIEGGYEFLLAYAAQGRRSDRDDSAGHGPRAKLQAMNEALEVLPQLTRDLAGTGDAAAYGTAGAYFEAFARDAGVAAAAIRLVLAQPDISSQLVDNLNASIHLRALLTDIFLIDEAFKGR
jgi:hypothetical protein